MNVYKKLIQARINLQSYDLKMTGRNEFSKYSYFELEDFTTLIQDITYEIGLLGIVSYNNDEASLTIIDVEDYSKIVITSPMKSANLKGCHEIQNLGAVMKYQRRYLWMTAFEIVEHDAIENSQPVETKKEKIDKNDLSKLTEIQKYALKKVRVACDGDIDYQSIQDALIDMEKVDKDAIWEMTTTLEKKAIRDAFKGVPNVNSDLT